MNPAYRKVVFSIEGSSPGSDFSIVTAWNPQSQPTPDSVNRVEDERLRQMLRALGENPIRVTGMSPDRSHREPGWTIENAATAERLAREFDQAALYRIEAGILKLIDLKTGSNEDLGKWQDFLVS